MSEMEGHETTDRDDLLDALHAEIEMLAAEVSALKADLAKARGLRCDDHPARIDGWPESMPTWPRHRMCVTIDGERIDDADGYFAQPAEGAPIFVASEGIGCLEPGTVFLREDSRQIPGQAVVEWFIPLDTNGQPCPVGGWGIAQ